MMITLDTRSLAIFRIALGLLLLCDLWVRSNDLTAHYTDEGVLPRSFFEKNAGDSLWLGPHFLSGSKEFQTFLFSLHALCAIALILGYKTRMATFFCWVLLLSLHDRNNLVLNGGDSLFRLLFFWSLFLPLGYSWSWESRAPPKNIGGIPSFALLLQVCLVYWMSVLYKWNVDWLTGKAVGYALFLDQFTTPLGNWLRDHPSLFPLLTYLTLGVEILGPLLVWLPFKNGFYKTLGVFTMILTHICFGAALQLGVFPAICMAAWLPFLPSSFWDRTKIPREIAFAHNNINILAAFLITYITIYNLADFFSPEKKWTQTLKLPGRYVHLDQKWNMFSRPLRDSGWYAVIGKIAGMEQKIDLWRGETMHWTPPYPVSNNFPNERWRKYLMNLWAKDFQQHRHYFVDYMVRKWEKEYPDEKVVAAQMIFIWTQTSDDFQKIKKRKTPLYTQSTSKIDFAAR